jgi:hypothetical protein
VSYVVRCENLEELKGKWDRIVSAHRDRVPNASFSPSAPSLQLLCTRLDRHSRIRWFYYTDNAKGVAIRLYDEEFRRQYPESFFEAPKSDGEEWVILRGESLGSSVDGCKQQMREAFDESWPASKAPSNDSARPSDTVRLGSSSQERIAYFQHVLRNNASGENPVSLSTNLQIPPVQFEQSIADTLQQFKQIILYGPPGTGKTRLARRIAMTVLNPGVDFENEEHLNQLLRVLMDQDRFNLVVFHPAYEYEQFVGGISPIVTDDKPLGYEISPGIFLRMARAAEQHAQPAVLIIDEINRGNLPKLLGELLYALEYRTAMVRLPFEWHGRSDLSVPQNLLLIGTMNSSDRSIGHIDVAVRRRFGLIHVEPDPSAVREFWSEFDAEWGEGLARLMVKLNSELDQCDRGGELRIGHAYFLANPTLPDLKQQVRRKWLFQVRQLLDEYRNVLNLPDDFLERYSGDLDAAL